jgi:hypothetical protein
MTGLYNGIGSQSWSGTSLTWSVATEVLVDATLRLSYGGYPTFSNSLTSYQSSLVDQAFDTWASVSGLSFQRVADGTSADIRLGWDTIDGSAGLHGGGTLAQATTWHQGTDITKAAIQFDRDDIGTTTFSTEATSSNQWSFLGTAIHEIGHTLGLLHVSDRDSIMYPYADGQTTLGQTDIANIQTLYGAATSTTVIPSDLASLKDAAIHSTTPSSLRESVDTAYYLSQYTDVRDAGVDPVVHYAMNGWREGRDPNSFFDTDSYLSKNPDVAAAGINPYDHYLTTGWKEGRDPSDLFDTDAYLSENPDVAAADINPLVHYLYFGLLEGRDIA